MSGGYETLHESRERIRITVQKNTQFSAHTLAEQTKTKKSYMYIIPRADIWFKTYANGAVNAEVVVVLVPVEERRMYVENVWSLQMSLQMMTIRTLIRTTMKPCLKEGDVARWHKENK
jgi:hypothetical protein